MARCHAQLPQFLEREADASPKLICAMRGGPDAASTKLICCFPESTPSYANILIGYKSDRFYLCCFNRSDDGWSTGRVLQFILHNVSESLKRFRV